MDLKEELDFIMDFKEEVQFTTDCKEEPDATFKCEEKDLVSFIYKDIPQETVIENDEKFTILGVTQPPSPVTSVETSQKRRVSTKGDDDEEWAPSDSNSSSEDKDFTSDEEWEPEPSGGKKGSVNKAKQKSVTSRIRVFKSTSTNIVVSHAETSQDAKFECPGCPYAFSTELFLKRHEKYCRHHHMDPSLVGEDIDYESQSIEVDEPSKTVIDNPTKNLADQPGTDAIATCTADTNDGTEGMYKCETCSVWFFNEKIFEAHRKTHTGVVDNIIYYYCPKCERPFVRKYHLANHIRIKHNSETPHKCDQCDKTFGRKTDLCMHIRTHVDKNFFCCTLCDKKFLLEERYKEHLTIHEEGHLVCTKCGQEFVRKSGLRKHMKRHDQEKCYTCSECNKQFSQKRHLTTHFRTHSGEQPYECTECGKKFSLRENYVRHLRSHTGDKPFGCDKCGKRFAVKANLQNHVWTHSEKKPHVCEICSRQFAEKNSLTRHLRTHTGEKPYLCSLCDKRFARKHHVKLHLQTHLKKDGEVVFSDCEDEIDVT